MSISEYRQRITAYKLKLLDKQLLLHQQAWLNMQVKAQKSKGKGSVSIYKTFKDFFDFNKIENEILNSEAPSMFVNK